MICSANELEMLAEKAARGGGAFPAQAAHFGKALVQHLVAGWSVTSLLDALNALPKGPIQTLPLEPASDVGNSLAQSYTSHMAVPARVTCPNDLYEMLSEFAARTYVPETEGSRLGGAGAGLNDND